VFSEHTREIDATVFRIARIATVKRQLITAVEVDAFIPKCTGRVSRRVIRAGSSGVPDKGLRLPQQEIARTRAVPCERGTRNRFERRGMSAAACILYSDVPELLLTSAIRHRDGVTQADLIAFDDCPFSGEICRD
jgi:hypothetical protein